MSQADTDGNLLNVFNQEINTNLDTYNKSKPEYHITNSNDVLQKAYRFNKSDFERSTLLLPDLSMARPGDILVKYTEGYPHVGVIVSADFTIEDKDNPGTKILNPALKKTEDYMKNIIVVSVKSGFKMVNTGVWLNESGVFGGFATPGDEKS